MQISYWWNLLKIENRFVLGIFVLFLMFNPYGRFAAQGQTNVGVENNDSFTFILNNYLSRFKDGSEVSSESTIWSDEEVNVRIDEEFTITFSDVTIIENDFINAEISNEDGDTADIELSLDDEFIFYTDWDRQKTDLQTEIDEFNADVVANGTWSGSTSIIDTSTEFGFIASRTYGEYFPDYTYTATYTAEFEKRIEKSTGILLYNNMKEVYTETPDEVDGNVEISTNEITVTRKGNSESSDDSALYAPFFLGLFAIGITVIIRKKKY